ncbi:MAG: GTP cyclohydrolase II [Acidobacteriota bacterium]
MSITELRCAVRTRLPTRHAEFVACIFVDPNNNADHVALVLGDPAVGPPPLVRLHSECLTGDALGSLRCDCGEQLEAALSQIAQEGRGVLLYLRQEGRGIGLLNKIRAYALQDQGLDTVEANEHLGFHADIRDYSVAAAMLKDLGVTSLRLLTNNPRKLAQLEAHGLHGERVPLVVDRNDENRGYLETKRTKLGHLLEPEVVGD